MKKITMLLMVLVMALFSALSCAPTVPQQEYDRVSHELSTVKSELSSLQGKLAEAETIITKNEELNKQYDIVKSEYDKVQSKDEGLGREFEELKRGYDNLQAEHKVLTRDYGELSKKYDAIVGEQAEFINEEDVEQAIFELINQERKNGGLDELIWGKYLYKWAKDNSQNMATKKQLEYSEYGSYQKVYRTTGYNTTKETAEAVMTVWKETKLYEKHFLNRAMVHGAVAVYKSAKIYNITFITDYYR